MKFPQSSVSSWILVLLATVSAAYGAWVAFGYEGGTAALMPFAVISLIGLLLAVVGAFQQRYALLGLGLVLQIFSPTGFAWVLSAALAVVGVVVLTSQRKASAQPRK